MQVPGIRVSTVHVHHWRCFSFSLFVASDRHVNLLDFVQDFCCISTDARKHVDDLRSCVSDRSPSQSSPISVKCESSRWLYVLKLPKRLWW
uniref:Uncharacterized protein n=1 Tax=Oryza brachyantha TaxID=4533 RepID=J3MIK9_ORYBR